MLATFMEKYRSWLLTQGCENPHPIVKEAIDHFRIKHRIQLVQHISDESAALLLNQHAQDIWEGDQHEIASWHHTYCTTVLGGGESK